MADSFDNNVLPRSIQEYVPGKQVTLAHLISKPDPVIYKKLGLMDTEYSEAIGILTLTPAESAIIAADICTKAANIKLGFVDRFSGSVIFVGEIAAVRSSLEATLNVFTAMNYSIVKVTRS